VHLAAQLNRVRCLRLLLQHNSQPLHLNICNLVCLVVVIDLLLYYDRRIRDEALCVLYNSLAYVCMSVCPCLSLYLCKSVRTSNFHCDYAHDFCRAMLCISAAIAVMRCLSVCPPVTFVDHVKTNNISSKFFHRQVATPF